LLVQGVKESIVEAIASSEVHLKSFFEILNNYIFLVLEKSPLKCRLQYPKSFGLLKLLLRPRALIIRAVYSSRLRRRERHLYFFIDIFLMGIDRSIKAGIFKFL
jgi:hypothetical protein